MNRNAATCRSPATLERAASLRRKHCYDPRVLPSEVSWRSRGGQQARGSAPGRPIALQAHRSSDDPVTVSSLNLHRAVASPSRSAGDGGVAGTLQLTQQQVADWLDISNIKVLLRYFCAQVHCREVDVQQAAREMPPRQSQNKKSPL